MIGTGTQGDGLADNLTIADSGNCGLTLRAGSSSLSSIFFADGTGANGYVGQQVYNHSDNSLKWIVNGSEALRITSAGLVGVGQATPTHMLHVDSSNASDSTATAFFKGRIIRFDGAASAHSPRLNFSLDGTDKAQILLHRTNIGLDIATLAAEPIKFKINSVEKLRISSEGYVTKPSTPAFFATHGGNSASGSTGYITYNTQGAYYNNGSHFDTGSGQFHAPVTGIYHFHFHCFVHNTATQTNVEIILRRFNSGGGGQTTLTRGFDNKVNSNYGPAVALAWTGPLTAGQYVQIYSYNELHHANGYYFGGYLVG